VKHFANPDFWRAYGTLPDDVRIMADKNYALLKSDPYHPSLHFKKVGNYWSARVGRRYRALAIEGDDGLVWFWIGAHGAYDKMVK
jgi:hypothetical protein